MLVKFRPFEKTEPGEMIDKETGEVIKWEKGVQAWVFVPDHEYPVVLKIKGDFPLNTDCTADLHTSYSKGVIRTRLKDPRVGWAESAKVAPVAPVVKSPI